MWDPRHLTPVKASTACYRDSQSQSYITTEVSRSVRLGVRHPSGTRNQFFPFSLWLFLDSCGFVDVGRPLWREDGSVICSAITQVQFQVILRPTVCRPVNRGAGSSPKSKSKVKSSQSHVMTDGQSISMPWCRVHSGTCDQVLLSVWKLLCSK
jgi:hypothetical protein